MTSVPNRRLLLSGNKALISVFLLLLLLGFAYCSPKLHTVAVASSPAKPVVPPPAKPAVTNQPAVVKVAKKRRRDSVVVSTISLLLPFGLNHLAAGPAYNQASLKEADMAVDYYQGFKLALDSLTTVGYNYKLLVFDTKDDKKEAQNLASRPAVQSSNLIVGPVFPDDIKSFTGSYSGKGQHIVSPLSASPPANYKCDSLITMIPPLEYHAMAVAHYVNDKIKAKKVFILKSGAADENDYINSFNETLDSLSDEQIKTVSLTVVRGQLNSLYPELSKTEQNVFVLPATNQRFLTSTLHALDSLDNNYPVTLIGHPSWINFSFLKTDELQRLDTHITSADQVDYNDAHTINFLKDYRKAYHAEPSAFAIKAYDEGLFFGKMLATDSLKNMAPVDFTGIHNKFHFERKPGAGWINTHVDILKYANFELKKVE